MKTIVIQSFCETTKTAVTMVTRHKLAVRHNVWWMHKTWVLIAGYLMPRWCILSPCSLFV